MVAKARTDSGKWMCLQCGKDDIRCTMMRMMRMVVNVIMMMSMAIGDGDGDW